MTDQLPGVACLPVRHVSKCLTRHVSRYDFAANVLVALPAIHIYTWVDKRGVEGCLGKWLDTKLSRHLPSGYRYLDV
jgi:hypothetical protein